MREQATHLWPGHGCFADGWPVNGATTHGGAVRRHVIQDPNRPSALHPDQSRYRNLTNDDVRRLKKMLRFAEISVKHAIGRLKAVQDSSLGPDPLRQVWEQQNFHCWWGEFHPRYSLRGTRICLRRYRRILGRLTSSQLHFKLRNWGFANIGLPHTWRIYLDGTFFQFQSAMEAWSRVTTLVHEAAHLVGVLRDTYHRGPSIDLAQRNRTLARTNADNYAFFAIDSYRINSGWLDKHDPDTKLARLDPTAPRLPVF